MGKIFNFKFLVSLIISFFYLIKVNYILVSTISVLFVIYFLWKNYRDRVKFEVSIVECLIYTLPFSFIPIVPGVEFISVFIVCQLFVILRFINCIRFKNFFSVLLFFILFLVTLLFLWSYGVEGESNVDTVLKYNLFLICCGISFYSFSYNKYEIFKLRSAYVSSAFVAGFTVLIQYLANAFLGIDSFGTQSRFGEVRQGFSGVFSDYSIMSIYIMSGALLVLLDLLHNREKSKRVLSMLLVLFFIICSALTSARSGLIAFSLVLVFYLLWSKKVELLFKMSVFAIPIFYVFFYIIGLNRKSSLASDAGRFDNFLAAYTFFIDNFLVGAGGVGYSFKTGLMVPHNLLLDMAVNFGIIITLFLMFFFIKLFFKTIRINLSFSLLLLFFMLGGMFHASFINTHYITVLVVLMAGSINGNRVSEI